MRNTANPELYRPIVRIIDDEESVRNSEAFTLRVAGFETVCYSSAEEFLQRDDSLHPGCIILDVRMPGMSGPELQQEINKREIDLPIIFLSAHGNIGLAVDTLKRGARDFYEKPVAPEILRETVARLVQENLQKADFKLQENREILKHVFDAKDVDMSLLLKLEEKRHIHENDFRNVQLTDAANKKYPTHFDFYFEYVLGLINDLEKFWVV